MKVGDSVKVYPHDDPGKSAVGKIVILSANQRSIAVSFDFMPAFAFHHNSMIGISAEHGVTFLAMREALNGVPWGPWIELTGQGHYEIEIAEGANG